MKTSHLIPLCAVLLAASVTAGHAQATPGNWCATTPDPPADFPSLAYNASTDAAIAGINQSRAAERLPALVLPRNYAQLPDEQKVIVLINLERTAHAEPVLGQFWTPIVGQYSTPIDTYRPIPPTLARVSGWRSVAEQHVEDVVALLAAGFVCSGRSVQIR